MIHLGVISSLCLVYIEFGGFWESSKTNVMEGIFGIHWSMNMIGELDIFVSRMPPFARPHSLWANANLRLPLSDLFVSYEKKKLHTTAPLDQPHYRKRAINPFFRVGFFTMYICQRKKTYIECTMSFSLSIRHMLAEKDKKTFMLVNRHVNRYLSASNC